MTLCDRLEAAQTERERRRNKSVSASLRRIDGAEEADDIRQGIQLHLRHLGRLTTEPGHLTELRRTIVVLGLRGRLAPQNSNDQPASELLAETASLKRNLDSSSTGRECVGDDDAPLESPFPLPPSWKWTRLGNLVQRLTVGYVGPMKHRYVQNGIPFLRSHNVRANLYREDGLVYISRN